MPGGSCGSWAGAASDRSVALWSATRKRFASGSRSAGRRLKKSPKGAPDHRFHRRKRTERTTPPLPHLGSTRPDAGAAIPLQLENIIGHCGCDLVELLFPAVSRGGSQPANHFVSVAPAAAHSRQAANRLGWATGTSQPRGVGLCSPAEGEVVAGVSSRLRPGTESGGVPVVALEAARAAQLLPGGFRPVEFARPQSTAP